MLTFLFKQILHLSFTNQAGWLAGSRVAGGWLSSSWLAGVLLAAWRLGGGWLAACWLVVDDDFDVNFWGFKSKNA